MARTPNPKYIVVGYNTEAYAPTDIANVSAHYDTFDEALACLKSYVEEDGYDPSLVDEEQGTFIAEGEHRGYYIAETIHGYRYLDEAKKSHA